MTAVLGRDDLGALFDALRADGWTVVGPTVRDDAIVYDEIDVGDLPVGWTDEQAPGRYRLVRRDDDRRFGYAVGPHSWKKYLFPPREVLHRTKDGVAEAPATAPTRRAFVGVRACEIAAIDIQDRVFVGGPRVDPRYAARREATLIVAVQCAEAGDLCFCASMGTGPRVEGGADLVLTELPDRYVVTAGSDRGAALLAKLPTRPALPADGAAVDAQLAACEADMGRSVDATELPGVLFANLDHARWDDVAKRCLSCGNCTLACPTCFCSNADEVSVLDTSDAERVRTWASCFTWDHGSIHGANFRPHTKERYRQWLTHKFGSWVSQYGVSGCVGCGRCIAWCPVGIDVTEELGAIRQGNAPIATPAPPAPATNRVDDLVPKVGEIVAVERETDDVYTLHVRAPGVPAGEHGAFNMVGLPGVGEVPISVSGTDGDVHVHTIRAVGAVTDALCDVHAGQTVQIRGPYGAGWPVEACRGRPVVVVGGGIGLAPLRTAVRAMIDRPGDFPDVRVFVGARTPRDLLFPAELLAWEQRPAVRVEVTVDRAAPGWVGHVGVVTRLLRPDTVSPDATVLVCGPELMMRFTAEAVMKLGVAPSRVYLSMERHMKCAAGVCGRCQYAHWFVCKDGPVFRYDTLAPVFGHEGF